MKKYFLSLIIFAFFSTTTAQQKKSDSIQVPRFSDTQHGAKELADSLNLISEKYIFLNTDSSLQYGQRALFIARKFNLKEAESKAYYLLGGNYWITGHYPNALESELRSLKISETINDRRSIADSYRALASIYRDNGDFLNAIYYAKKCEAIAGKNILVDILTITGSIYEKFNHPDSALYYLNLADREDIIANGTNHYGYISLVFGNVYYKKQDFALAIKYYLKGIYLTESQKVLKDLIEGCNGIAKVYMATGKPDSAKIYLQKSIMLSRETPFILGTLESGNMLSLIYKSQSKLDSAIKYMGLSLNLKDTLYNQDKARAFQTLVFQEKLREQEIEELKAKAAEDHIKNVQIASISVFIPIFFIVAFLLSRKKMNRGLIEFLVLVWLLFVFEFISLLIHPHLESWTHDSPIFMLLAMVLIAAILVPTHHRLLHFLKTALTKPHKEQIEKLSVENIQEQK